MEKFDFALFYSPPSPSLQVERGNTKGGSKKKGGKQKIDFTPQGIAQNLKYQIPSLGLEI